jgi:ankyrin repeat protein
VNPRIVRSALLILSILFCVRTAAAKSDCALCKPAYDGDLAGVVAALGHHAPVNVHDSNGWTPLLYAVGKEHEEVALVLLEHGADANVRLPDSRTPLLFAVLNQQLKLVQALLDHKENASEKYSDGWTPLLLAAQNPAETQMLELLLAHHADTNATTPNGWTALDVTLQNAWNPDNAPPLKALQLLLSYGANPNKSGRPGASPAVWAALTGRDHKEILALMIASGADPNTMDSMHDSILSDVVTAADPDLVLMLLKAGTNWKTAGYQSIPMMSVACQAPPGRIALLAQHGVDFNWRGPGMRGLAEDRFCWTHDSLLALVDQSVYLDAEMPAQGGNGASPLFDAAANATADEFRLLLQAGADLPSPDRAGYNPMLPDPVLLFTATQYNANKVEIYPMLQAYGVDLLAKNSEGQTVVEALDAVYANNKSDAAYLQARELLTSAVHARMLTRGFILSAMDTLEKTPQESQAEAYKKTFLEGLELNRRDPGCIELRFVLAAIAAKMRPTPPASDEALQHEKAAKAAYDKAHARSEMLGVAMEYEWASALSPWVGAYYKNLCTVYELSGSYGRAKRNCMIYLASSPSDAGAIRTQVQRLQTEIEKATQ